mmetsp:Transcript_6886/g.13007  ORF Transcript_6886/g.13007 Transcript_6886/m.13007 type:complete len:230 (-) Transcript_6886:63-752(-)
MGSSLLLLLLLLWRLVLLLRPLDLLLLLLLRACKTDSRVPPSNVSVLPLLDLPALSTSRRELVDALERLFWLLFLLLLPLLLCPFDLSRELPFSPLRCLSPAEGEGGNARRREVAREALSTELFATEKEGEGGLAKKDPKTVENPFELLLVLLRLGLCSSSKTIAACEELRKEDNAEDSEGRSGLPFFFPRLLFVPSKPVPSRSAVNTPHTNIRGCSTICVSTDKPTTK